MKASIWIVTLWVLSLAFDASAADSSSKIIADFNAPAPNNVEGNWGAFSPSETEQVFLCRESLDETIKHGDTGASLCLQYNVSRGGAFNGFWMKLGPGDSGNKFDASGYKKLCFWIKGDDKSGIPSKVKIELKGDPGAPFGKKYIGELSDKWKKVEIPLDEFSKEGAMDMTALNEIVFVFEQRAAAPATTGGVYIDDVAFEK